METAEEIREKYNKILVYVDEIRKEIKTLKANRAQATADYKNDMEVYETKFKEIQARCPHINTKYTPDASGNNDSSTDCEDCGKYLGR